MLAELIVNFQNYVHDSPPNFLLLLLYSFKQMHASICVHLFILYSTFRHNATFFLLKIRFFLSQCDFKLFYCFRNNRLILPGSHTRTFPIRKDQDALIFWFSCSTVLSFFPRASFFFFCSVSWRLRSAFFSFNTSKILLV